MTGLLDLPDDVLRDIVEGITSEPSYFKFQYSLKHQPTLLSLRRTNRRLSILSTRILMHGIDVSIVSNDNVDGVDELNVKFTSLLEALKRNPPLGSLVHKINLVWEKVKAYGDRSTITDQGVANARSNQLLALLPNIESLRVESNPDCSPFRPDFLKSNPTPNLRLLIVPWMGASYVDVLEYLKIASLNHLSVHYPKRVALGPEVIEARRSQAPSNVSHLFFGMNHLPFSDLSVIFAQFAGVKTLDMATPFLASEDDRKNEPELYKWKRNLSPQGIGQLLGIFKHSLVTLRLSNHSQGARFESQDGSRLDLSGFDSLTTLSVSQSCFFAADDPDPSRDGLWKLFPMRLESLKIWFDDDKHFAYSREELNAAVAESELYRFNRGKLPKDTERYNWLREIADRKPDHFSNLIQVKIEERRHEVWGARYIDPLWIRPWRVPAELREAFDGVGIALSGRIRLPKGRLPENGSWGTTDEEDTEEEESEDENGDENEKRAGGATIRTAVFPLG